MFKSLKSRIIVIFGAFVFSSLALVTFLSSKTIIKTAETFATAQGVPVVSSLLSYIDGNQFEALTKVMSEDDPYYEQLRLYMLDLKIKSGCKYLYTMAKFGNTYKYVVDGSCDPSDEENFSPIGSEEDLESWGNAPIEALTEGSMTNSGLEKQENWGWTISTYQGIKNSSGKVVGMIGCDFDLGNFVENMKNDIIRISIISLVLLAIGCFIIWLLTRMIFGSIDKTAKAMGTISRGEADLTSRIPETGGLELEMLSQNCNNVIASLNKLVANLQKESGVLTQSSSHVKDEMNNHIRQIDDTVSKVDSINEGINEQFSDIETIANSVRAVETEIHTLRNRLSEQNDAISKSSAAIEQISDTIKSVNQNVNKINTKFDDLVQESEYGLKNQAIVDSQVQTIVEESKNLTMANQAIADISKQTNLLAMNAAIEAAHAGEAGKGFGVVADEIRVLAETSAKQSKEIKKLLATVTESIEQIVHSSQTSTQSFHGLGEKITSMDSLIKDVQDGMSKEDCAVQNILSMVSTLNAAAGAITAASNQMENESLSLFSKIDGLQKLSKQTMEHSSQVSSTISMMKEASKSTLEATEKNQEATEKVISMITGFKV